jgi:hypothetical protein
MRATGTTFSRRSFLFGALAITVAACRPRKSHQIAATAPDASALAAAADGERQLLAQYDAALAADPALAAALSAARERHARHLSALGGPAPSAAASPPSTSPSSALPATDPRAGLVSIRQSERDSVVALQAAATAATRGDNAALLASVAAAHAAAASHPVNARSTG